MAKGFPTFGIRWPLAVVTCGLVSLAAPAAHAQSSISPRELEIIARALPFVRPPPNGQAWVAVAFAPNDAASQRDAERIVEAFGAGIRSGNATLHARAVAADTLGTGDYAVLIAAAGAPGSLVMAASRARRVACVATTIEQVQSGQCAVWVHSGPRVEIIVSRAALEASGVGLAPAFRLMVREL